MEFNLVLDKKDFLTAQLYFASRSEATKKARKRNQLILSIGYGVLGVIMITLGDTILGVLFLIAGIAWYFYFPKYEGKKIASRLAKHQEEVIRSKFGTPSFVDINKERIIDRDNGQESTISITELKEVCDIPSYFFLYLKSGVAIILPKVQIDDVEACRTFLRDVCTENMLPYTRESEWAWK